MFPALTNVAGLHAWCEALDVVFHDSEGAAFVFCGGWKGEDTERLIGDDGDEDTAQLHLDGAADK